MPEMQSWGDGMVIQFTAYCKPEPQGSIRAFVPKSGKMAGRAILTSTNKNLKGFRLEIEGAACKARWKAGLTGLAFVKHVPVSLKVNFFLERPVSAPSCRIHPSVQPDLDKLLRAVCDALTGVLWHDDAQVVHCEVRKLYGSPERVEVQVCEG